MEEAHIIVLFFVNICGIYFCLASLVFFPGRNITLCLRDNAPVCSPLC